MTATDPTLLPRPRTARARAVRVLLAEDDDDLRAALTAVLRHEGFSVTPLANGAALLDELASFILGERGHAGWWWWWGGCWWGLGGWGGWWCCSPTYACPASMA
jgi:hypothetical protein